MNATKITPEDVTAMIVKIVNANRDLQAALDALNAGDTERTRELILQTLLRFGSLEGSEFIEALQVQIRGAK